MVFPHELTIISVRIFPRPIILHGNTTLFARLEVEIDPFKAINIKLIEFGGMITKQR